MTSTPAPRSSAAVDLDAAAELLRCPLCARPLAPAGSALRCPERHTFDVSRQGCISLLGGAKAVSGDDDDMARAREAFLATGAYAPLRDAVAELAAGEESCGAGGAGSARDRVVLDIGAGTGYYLAGALGEMPGARGIALDTSPRALRVAARAHPRAIAATWDAFKPFPLADASVDAVLDVFAPRNPAEFARVLRPGGRLVVARPTPRHLAELREEVGAMVSIDPAKEERLARALDPFFTPITTREVTYALPLDPEQARALIGMTPSARHLDAASVSANAASVTVSVLVTAYAPREVSGGR
ncbi:putative RNA methyltransferase [Brachybacterium huguangmaarense]